MDVIKRDGRIEKFSKEKMVRAIVNAGAKLNDAKAIADRAEKEFGKREKISSSELRRFVISELEKLEKDIAKRFAEFVKVKREIAKTEEFDKKLVALCGESGVVRHVYGGYEIEINDEIVFDYSAVFLELIRIRKMKVSIEERDGKIVIIARP
ncbi:MAG: ATP cone domain-containing protein [Candidatus Anstonellales archaeon]